MHKKKAIIIIILILVLLGYSYYYFANKFDLLDDCNNEQIAENISPDSQYVARHFVRDCGATTDFTTHLEIGDVKTGESESVIIFNGKIIEGLNITWPSSSSLRVEFAGDRNKVFKISENFKSVSIQLVSNGEDH